MRKVPQMSDDSILAACRSLNHSIDSCHDTREREKDDNICKERLSIVVVLSQYCLSIVLVLS